MIAGRREKIVIRARKYTPVEYVDVWATSSVRVRLKK